MLPPRNTVPDLDLATDVIGDDTHVESSVSSHKEITEAVDFADEFVHSVTGSEEVDVEEGSVFEEGS